MWGFAVAFLVLGVLAVRRASAALGHVVVARSAAPGAAAPVRLVTALTGYVIVFFGTLGILRVGIEHLLVGAGLAGVVLGIAGQQSLGNVFAGIVLITARPFTVGDSVRIRSGALGGIFEGVVMGMSLTYVTLNVEGTPIKIPNSGMLAAGVGRIGRRSGQTGPVPVVTGQAGSAPGAGAPGGQVPADTSSRASPTALPEPSGSPPEATRAAPGKPDATLNAPTADSARTAVSSPGSAESPQPSTADQATSGPGTSSPGAADPGTSGPETADPGMAAPQPAGARPTAGPADGSSGS